SHTEFLMKKAGAVGAANVGYYFSHRSTNTDLTLYSFNGSAYASVFEATRSGVTKWGASTYHVFQNYASTLQFETTSGGVNIPSGKTYQIGGVDAFAAVSSFSRDAAGYSGISYNPSDFVLHVITGINNAYTISGTTTGAANGMLHIIRLKDAGVSKTLGFSGFTAFKSSFPTATTPGKWMYFTCRYNSAGSSWDIIDFAVQN
ncbi:MAG: hypothetical protein NTV01_00105, partial [Bacteroidia bacterium]|nr:hypothetical protein [Bacteroidia bacterium]